MHSDSLGFLTTKALVDHIAKGHVLIAEEASSPGGAAVSAVKGPNANENGNAQQTGGTPAPPKPLGYIIARDQYTKHDDIGIIYQLNVTPGSQRNLVGAALVKATFERAAYGCKLFCCWCAQDLSANHFWEAMGFLPLAFRTGSRTPGKERIHIFWQRRVREGDTETPYWFPSQTIGGMIQEGRLVIPIPPGTHWSDPMPMILPGMGKRASSPALPENEEGETKPRRKKRPRKRPEPPKLNLIARHGVHTAPIVDPPPPDGKPKKKCPKREKRKNDPKHIATARELRDRYLEEINLPENARMLPEMKGKYDVSRQLESAPTHLRVAPNPNLLNAA